MTREVFKQSFTNASAIVKASSAAAQFNGALYFEMNDSDAETYGACNVMSVHNGSDQDAQIWFGMGYSGTVDSNPNKVDLPARATKNIKPEDSIRFYRFRIVNRNTATDIAAGGVTGRVSRVEE